MQQYSKVSFWISHWAFYICTRISPAEKYPPYNERQLKWSSKGNVQIPRSREQAPSSHHLYRAQPPLTSSNRQTIEYKHLLSSHLEHKKDIGTTGHLRRTFIVSVSPSFAVCLLTWTEHTLSLLFSAQQNNSPQFGSLLKQSPIPSISQRPESHTQQSSLHAFWRLPHTRQISPPSNSCANWFIAPTSPNIPSFSSEVTNCEDCDAPLICNDSDAMDIDIMMAIDNMGEANYSCTRCAKPVCSHCSVSNLGRERKCLGCVGRSQNWPGGIK